jgi:peptidoglycan/LPS O-acetylase OafA/YrhL
VSPPQITSGADFWTFTGLVQNYRNGYELRGIGVAWTLVIEVSFYLMLPLIARLLRSRRGTPRTIVTRQLLGIVGLAAVGVGVRVWAIWIKSPHATNDGAFRPWRAPDKWLLGYLDWFALGMLIAVAAAWAASGRDLPAVVRGWARHAAIAWVVGVGAYSAVAWLVTFPPPGLPYSASARLIVSTVVPLAAATMVLPIALEPTGGALRRALGSRAFVAVGAVSYGIYLWHLTAIRWTREWIDAGTIPSSAAVQTLLVLAIVAATATLSFLLVERPLMRWSARRARRRGLVVRPSTA